MTLQEFQADVRAGIPKVLPEPQPYDPDINHAPKPRTYSLPRKRNWPCATLCATSPARCTQRCSPSLPMS